MEKVEKVYFSVAVVLFDIIMNSNSTLCNSGGQGHLMTSSLLAELYWPSCVSIGRVALYRPSLSLI